MIYQETGYVHQFTPAPTQAELSTLYSKYWVHRYRIHNIMIYRDSILLACMRLNIVRTIHLWVSMRSIQRSALTWTIRRQQPAGWRRGWFLQATKPYERLNDVNRISITRWMMEHWCEAHPLMVGRLWDPPFVGILLCLATGRIGVCEPLLLLVTADPAVVRAFAVAVGMSCLLNWGIRQLVLRLLRKTWKRTCSELFFLWWSMRALLSLCNISKSRRNILSIDLCYVSMAECMLQIRFSRSGNSNKLI